MTVDYTPNQNKYKDIGSFRFWCQKVLPLVYDDSLSYYELLNKVVQYLNDTIENIDLVGDDMTKVYTAYKELQNWVNGYFDNLDVQEEINAKLDSLANDGTLNTIVSPFISQSVSKWLSDNVNPSNGGVIDSSLSITGASADAKAVGKSIHKVASVVFESIADVNVAFDTVNKTITFKTSWACYYNTVRFFIVPNTVISYDIEETNSLIVGYDQVTETIQCRPYTSYDNNFIVVFTFHASQINSLSVNASYTVDGAIKTGAMRRQNVAVMNCLTSNALPIAMNFDTVNGMLTFLTSAVVSFAGRQHIIDSNTVVPYPTEGSTTVLVVWNYTNNEIKAILSHEYNDNYAVMFMFQRNYLQRGGLSISEPYAVDGTAIRLDSSDNGINVIKLTSDTSNNISVNVNTVVYGNGFKVDLGHRLRGSFLSGIMTTPYTAIAGGIVDRVFVSKSLPLSDTQNTRPYHYVTVWAVSYIDDSESIILTPYATANEVYANDNSFTYDGTNFIVHVEDNSKYDEIVLVDKEVSCLSASNCDIKVYDTKFLFAYHDCARIRSGSYTFHGCEFAYCVTGNGLSANLSSGEVVNCVAHHVNNDGFNYHNGFSNKMVGCRAYLCEDDGVSHHDKDCIFSIIGGEFSYNKKGGISSPTTGCKGEIRSCYLHDNGYGVYAVNTTENIVVAPIMVSDCLIIDNNVGILSTGYHVMSYHNTITDNGTDTSGAVTSY